MKKLLSTLALLVALLAPGFRLNAAAAPAATSAVPDIVSKGFDAYKTANANAIDTWFKGSPLETNTDGRVKVASQLNSVEKVYGKFLGWELIKVAPLTASTEIVYAVAKFEKAPLWFAFDCYKAADQWTITSLRINQNAESILPESLLAGQ